MLINHGVVCKTFGLGRTAEVGSREGMKGKAGNKDDSIKQFREQNSECIVTMDSKVTIMPGESACFLSLFFLDGSHICVKQNENFKICCFYFLLCIDVCTYTYSHR